jgi:O-antigen/teichoic acid export membrane protein
MAVAGHLSLAGLAWLLAPSLGIMGVGIAFLVSAVFHVIMNFARLRMHFGLTLSRRHVVAVVYGVTALSIAAVLTGMLDPWQPQGFAVRVLAYVAFAASLLGLLEGREIRQLVVRGQTLLFPQGTKESSRIGGATYRRLTRHFFPEVW